MKKPEIQAVRSYGCGSPPMLRMNIEVIAKQHNVKIEVFCGDVATCYANDYDVILISKKLAQRIEGRAKAPIAVFNNFMNKQEAEEKTLIYFEILKQSNRRTLWEPSILSSMRFLARG